MKRNIKTIIAVAVLLILLVGAYIFVQKMNKDKNGDNQQIANEEIKYIITEKPEDIASIQYNAGEVAYTIYGGDTPTIEGYSSHIISTDMLDSALLNTANMSFSLDMGEQADLAKYGLDTEDKFILYKMKNGDEHKLIIGNPTHMNGEYYARMSDSNVVYTLSGTTAELLMCHPGIFRDTKICVVDNYNISQFAIEQSGVKVLEIARDEEFAKENGFIQSSYIIKYPYYDAEANNDSINMLFENIVTVYATSIVEEDPEDLSVYGLDRPYTLTVKDKDGETTVKMGKYADDGTVYVMRNDIPVVFTAVCAFYEPVKTLVPDEFVARYIHIFKIDDVESVVVENSTQSHTLSVTEKTDGTCEYSIDGRIKVEDSFKEVYETIISPISAKIVSDIPQGDEKCKITFTMKNGNVKTFVYYQYNDKNYIVKADNGLVCLVKKVSIDNIFTTINN